MYFPELSQIALFWEYVAITHLFSTVLGEFWPLLLFFFGYRCGYRGNSRRSRGFDSSGQSSWRSGPGICGDCPCGGGRSCQSSSLDTASHEAEGLSVARSPRIERVAHLAVGITAPQRRCPCWMLPGQRHLRPLLVVYGQVEAAGIEPAFRSRVPDFRSGISSAYQSPPSNLVRWNGSLDLLAERQPVHRRAGVGSAMQFRQEDAGLGPGIFL